MRDRNTNAQSADLPTGWRDELDGSANAGCLRITIRSHRERIVSIGSKRKRVRSNLRAVIVTDDHCDIGLLA